jgi:hypothetical protein
MDLPNIWAKLSDGELLDRLQYYWFLATNSPLGPPKYARVVAQLLVEADKRGKSKMWDEARQWVKSHKPVKQE